MCFFVVSSWFSLFIYLLSGSFVLLSIVIKGRVEARGLCRYLGEKMKRVKKGNEKKKYRKRRKKRKTQYFILLYTTFLNFVGMCFILCINTGGIRWRGRHLRLGWQEKILLPCLICISIYLSVLKNNDYNYS